MPDNYLDFEQAFQRAVRDLREKLRAANIGSSFRFTAQASGRVQEGSVQIKISLDDGYYSSTNSVEGNTTYAVVEEYLRRHGWSERHQPLELDYAPEPKAEPETTEPAEDAEDVI